MSYCINPKCYHRTNPDDAKFCQFCDTQLLLEDRFQVLEKVSTAPESHPWEVFKVKDTLDLTSGEFKALKILKIQNGIYKKLFNREKMILKRSRHPGIPAYITDFLIVAEGHRPDLDCLVMEWIEGQDLRKWLIENKIVDENIALQWLKKMVIILAYLHNKNYFHRDIKPGNIILKKNGDLALIDFGIVREITDEVIEQGAETECFSRMYAPSEQIIGAAVPQSDFYALGKTFVHLLVGDIFGTPKLDPDEWQYATNFPTSGIIPLLKWLLHEDFHARPHNPEMILDVIDYISRCKADDDFPNDKDTKKRIDRIKYQSSQVLNDDQLKEPLITTVMPSSRNNTFDEEKKIDDSLSLKLWKAIAAFTGVFCVVLILRYRIFPFSNSSYVSQQAAPKTVVYPPIVPAEGLMSFGDRRIDVYQGYSLSKNALSLKKSGIDLFRSRKYKDAYQIFYKLRLMAKEDDYVRSQPDLLIYMNNAKVRYWHEKNGKKIYTIIAAVPADTERGQQILFGIAHAQNDVVTSDDRPINLDVEPEIYLEIGMIDDRNNPRQAIEIAKTITSPRIRGYDSIDREVLAVIGHYTSEATCASLPIYSQEKLTLISPTNKVNEIQQFCGDKNQVFHRTISSGKLEAEKIIEYLKSKHFDSLKIISFYAKGKREGRSGKLGFGQDMFNLFKEEFKREFGKDLEDGFDLSDRDDVERGIRKAINANVIALFPDENIDIKNNITPFASVIDALTEPKESNESNEKKLILVSSPVLSLRFGEKSLQQLSDKLVVAVDWSTKCASKEFTAQQEKLFGVMGHTTAHSYEAVQILTYLFKQKISKREDILSNLNKNNDVDSKAYWQSRKISFDNGNRSEITIKDQVLLTPHETGKKYVLINNDQCSR